MTKRVILVAAVARNGVIGNGSEIPWKVPGEQRLFKELTMGDVARHGPDDLRVDRPPAARPHDRSC